MSIVATEKWWSARQVPSIQDADPNNTDTTEYKCHALAEDGTYLYAGVGPYIIRYDLAGNASLIGTVDWGSLGLRVSYLEIDGTDLYFVVETTDTDISTDEAHTRGWGSIDLTNIDSYIVPNEGAFYKYDKGCRVDSLDVLYHNYRAGGAGGMSDGICRWYTETIGWGTPGPFKDGGIPKLLSIRSTISSSFNAPAGQHHIHVDTAWVEGASTGTPAEKPYEQYIGGYVWAGVWDGTDEQQAQFLGKCTDIIGHKPSGTWVIKFELPIEFDLTQSLWTNAYMYITTDTPGARAPYPNVFVPTYMDCEVGYYFDELDDRPKEEVHIERKWRPTGQESFFYPDTVATASEGDKVSLVPGMHSFISSLAPEQFTNSLSQEEAYGSTVSPFYVDFDWIDDKQQYILSEGLVVENERQPNEYRLCGDNTVTKAGVVARWQDDSPVKCPGNIYLYKGSDGEIYVMVNEVMFSAQPDMYTRVRIGKWNSVGYFDEIFYDRNNNTDSPKYYPNIDAYVGHELCISDGTLYGFRRKYARNWVDTELLIGWAAPPQTGLRPADWEGGLAASVLVRGDRTDLLTTPGIIRTNDVKKTFRISETATTTVQPADDGLAIDEWVGVVDLYTRMILKSIRTMKNWDAPWDTHGWAWGIGQNTSYTDQVQYELLDETISVAQGFDIRDEVFTIIGGVWLSATDIYFENTKILEGETDPDNPEIDEYIATIDDAWTLSPRFNLDHPRVRNVSSVMIDEQEFTVTDITGELTITVPDEKTVYVKRNEGDEFDETYIYVNNKYLDDEFQVEYTYYPIGDLQHIFSYDNTLYYNFTSEDFNIWYEDGVENWAPGVKERGVYSNVVELDGEFYAVTQPSYALRQYSQNWSEYIEEFATNKRGWDILGQISGANDQVLYEWNGIYVLKDETTVYKGTLENIVSIRREDVPPFDEVEIKYKNGTYYSADTKATEADKQTYKRTLSYVSDYLHAKTIGDAILTFYSDLRGKYTVIVDEYRHDIRFGDVFDILNTKGKVVKIDLLGTGQTHLTLYEVGPATALINANQTLI